MDNNANELEWMRQNREAISKVLSEVGYCLKFNGGPIDAEDTVNGTPYVMVRRQDFEAMELAYKVLHRQEPAPPPEAVKAPALDELQEFAKQYCSDGDCRNINGYSHSSECRGLWKIVGGIEDAFAAMVESAPHQAEAVKADPGALDLEALRMPLLAIIQSVQAQGVHPEVATDRVILRLRAASLPQEGADRG